MIANLYAASGFRRRSYDDQEGDNDISIIIQPSDLDDIENEARAKYAKYLSTFGTIHNQSANYHRLATKSEDQHYGNKGQIEATKTSKRTSAFKPPRYTAMTNIFNDMKLAKCLLDQDYNQTVRLFIEKSALNWNFNSFTFDALCCGRSLTELLLHLFDHYNLYNIFNLDIVKVLKCFRLLEYGYHSTNPYHNSVHAADVTQAMHCFMQENKIRRHMTDLEILCSILAAVCHDLDHPGVNQSFLVATNNPLAGLYQNNSVLENHHWRFALCIFREAKLFDHFSHEVLADMREQLKHLILATDIARQNDYLKRFRELTLSHNFSMKNTDDRALVLQMALKCADLGNSCRPWLISRVWSNLICDEFYRMGKIERQLGVPLTPICQREKTSIAGIQTDFFRFIVLPLLELWHKFLDSPLSNLLMSNFDHNYKRWQRANRIVQQLRRRKSIACLEPMPDDGLISLSDDESNLCGHISERNRFCIGSKIFSGQQEAGIVANSLLISNQATESDGTSRSFSAIKRASSDYIKSGNGRLELLRDFQLDRIIERSPLVARRKAVKVDLQKQQQHASSKLNSTPSTNTNKPIATSNSNKKSSLQKSTAQQLKLGSTSTTQQTALLNNENNNCKLHDLSQITETTTTTTIEQKHHHRNPQINSSAILANVPVARQSGPSTSTTTLVPCSIGRLQQQQQQQQQQMQVLGGNYRNVLSPIEDGGEGPSPELGPSSTSHNDRDDDDNEQRLSKVGVSKQGSNPGERCCYSSSGGCYGSDVAAFKLEQPKATTDTTSSTSSQSDSRASSVCSSSPPVMQRSCSPRTSIDQSLSPLHIKQKHHHKHQRYKQRTAQNYPSLAQYYEQSSGTRIKPINLVSGTRQSVSVSFHSLLCCPCHMAKKR